MPSLRSGLLARALAITAKPLSERARPGGLDLMLLRAVVDLGGATGVPRGTWSRRVRGGPVPGTWLCGPGASRSRGVMLHLHGGGFVFGSSRSHRSLAARLSAASGLAAFVPDYRRAPEHRYPAAQEDALAAYRMLLAQGTAPARITLVGDSVGGHLVATLIADIRAAGLPGPAGVLLMSPALDLTGARARALDATCADPFLSLAYGLRCMDAYLGDVARDDVRVQVIEAEKAGWPPVLIQVGGREVLCADAEALEASLAAAGVPCEVQIWPGQVHVFQGFAGLVPEARAAVQAGAGFLRECVGERDHVAASVDERAG